MNKLYIFCQNPGLVVQEVRTNMVVATGELKLEDAMLKMVTLRNASDIDRLVNDLIKSPI